MSMKDIKEVQEELDKMGVKDVKFFFTDVKFKPNSLITEEIALVLDLYLRGFSEPMKPLGDSKRVLSN